MTKRPFRLTYINARRPYGVAGSEHNLLTRLLTYRVRRETCNEPTENSRAIHGSYREPPINARSDNRFRTVQYSLLLGCDGAGWPELRRPFGGRCTNNRIDCRHAEGQYNCRRRHHSGERRRIRSARPTDESIYHLVVQ